MEWISVKDKLPEPETEVLVCRDFDSAQYYIEIVEYDYDSHDNLGFVTYDYEYDCIQKVDDVAYWMPIPEPPNPGGNL